MDATSPRPVSPAPAAGAAATAEAAARAALEARFPRVTFVGDATQIRVWTTVTFEGAATLVAPASLGSCSAPLSIGDGARIERSAIIATPFESGPLHIGAGVVITGARLEDSSVAAGSQVRGGELIGTIVGRGAAVTGCALWNCTVMPGESVDGATVRGTVGNPTVIGSSAVSVGRGGVFVGGDARGDVHTERIRGATQPADAVGAVARGAGSVAVAPGGVFIGGALRTGGSVNTGDVVVVHGGELPADVAKLLRELGGRLGRI